MDELETALTRIETSGAPAVLVEVVEVSGSVPRGTDAKMLVFDDRSYDTIGGGNLEFQALDEARRLLARYCGGVGPDESPRMKTYVLGASLGQCCGGKVGLRLSVVDAAKVISLRKQLARDRYPLILFGAGHVGRALVRVLAGSPFSITWVDPREDAFSENDVDTSWLHICHTDDPTEALDDAAPGSYALVMTHRHDLDYDLSKQAIMRDDLSFVGLIGSATKKASFLGRLRRDGCAPENISRLQCPIGVEGITGKEPYAIAVSVAAQLLQRLEISGRVYR